MKKILKFLLYLVLGLILLVCVLGLFAKKDYHIERSTTIEAPGADIMEHVKYFKNFSTWSPWHAYDPNMTVTIPENDGKIGALYTWKSKEMGDGQQTITSLSDTRIDWDVQFSDFGTSPVYMSMKDQNGKTDVTWSMDMHVPFPWNAMGMLMDMNNYIGKDYENGLANLKKVMEEMASKQYNGYTVKLTDAPVQYYYGVRQTVSFQDIPKYFANNFPKLGEAINKAGGTPAGLPSGLYWNYDMAAMKTDMAAAIKVAGPVKNVGVYQQFEAGGKKAAVIDYYGNYAGTEKAHSAMEAYMNEHGLQWMQPCVEEYVTDPGAEPDTAKWLTRIIYFVQPRMQ